MRIKLAHLLILSALFCQLLFSIANAKVEQANQGDAYLTNGQVQDFMDNMVRKHKFSRSHLTDLFKQAEKKESILEAIQNPAEGGKLSWQKYHDIFITKGRIEKGKEILSKYSTVLGRLEKKYGVSRYVLVAIMGVETFYGKHIGKHRVFDALATIAFNYQRRHKFFASELENYLLFCRKYKLDPMSLRGSYAGAMGLPQFMPSSYLRYAKSYSGEGFADIWEKPQDAFTSIANYLQHFGWQRNAPALVPMRASSVAGSTPNSIKASMSYKKAKKAGWHLQHKTKFITNNTPVAPISLEYEGKKQAWFGLKNLQVISRYNHSLYYTLVVGILADKLR